MVKKKQLKQKPKNSDEQTPIPDKRSFSDVLRHHGFTYGSHFEYSWMQLWRRGSLQYCEVSPAPRGSNTLGSARIVGAGLGEESFDDPEVLNRFLSAANVRP